MARGCSEAAEEEEDEHPYVRVYRRDLHTQDAAGSPSGDHSRDAQDAGSKDHSAGEEAVCASD